MKKNIASLLLCVVLMSVGLKRGVMFVSIFYRCAGPVIMLSHLFSACLPGKYFHPL